MPEQTNYVIGNYTQEFLAFFIQHQDRTRGVCYGNQAVGYGKNNNWIVDIEPYLRSIKNVPIKAMIKIIDKTVIEEVIHAEVGIKHYTWGEKRGFDYTIKRMLNNYEG